MQIITFESYTDRQIDSLEVVVMHEEKVALVRSQIAALKKAVASREIENIYLVACGGSLATLYPAKYILERETDKVSTDSYTCLLYTSRCV